MNKIKLKNKEFTITKIILTSIFSQVGSSIFAFACGFYLLSKTGSALIFALSLLIGPIVSVLLMPFSGTIIDKHSHKKVIIISEIVGAVGLYLFFIVYSFQPKYFLVEILSLIVILKVSAIFVQTSLAASTVTMVSETNIQKVNSLNQIISGGANIIGPAIGGVVYGLLTLNNIAMIQLLFESLVIIVTFSLNFNKYNKDDSQNMDAKNKKFTQALSYIKKDQVLTSIIIGAMLFNFLITSCEIGVPYILIHHLGIKSTLMGVIEASFSVGMIFGGIILSIVKIKKDSFTMFSITGVVFSFCLMFLALPIILSFSKGYFFIAYIVLYFIFGMIVASINVPLLGYIQTTVRKEMQGRVITVLDTTCMALIPIGTLLFGTIFGVVSSSNIFTLSGIFGLILFILLKIMSRKQGKQKRFQYAE